MPSPTASSPEKGYPIGSTVEEEEESNEASPIVDEEGVMESDEDPSCAASIELPRHIRVHSHPRSVILGLLLFANLTGAPASPYPSGSREPGSTLLSIAPPSDDNRLRGPPEFGSGSMDVYGSGECVKAVRGGPSGDAVLCDSEIAGFERGFTHRDGVRRIDSERAKGWDRAKLAIG